MYRFIQSSIRGGLVYCCHRYTKANNKYLSDYDSSKESSFLMYVDANNLYCWAMPQLLPYKDFKWMSNTDIDNFDINNIPFDSKYGLEINVNHYTPMAGSSFIPLPRCLLTKKAIVNVCYKNDQYC